jgi:hypothetical protein
LARKSGELIGGRQVTIFYACHAFLEIENRQSNRTLFTTPMASPNKCIISQDTTIPWSTYWKSNNSSMNMYDHHDEQESVAQDPPSKRYTSAEELLICKAYMATSEDPVCGNKMGTAEFKKSLEENYRCLLDEYIHEQMILKSARERRESSSSDESKAYKSKKADDILVNFDDRKGNV